MPSPANMHNQTRIFLFVLLRGFLVNDILCSECVSLLQVGKCETIKCPELASSSAGKRKNVSRNELVILGEL